MVGKGSRGERAIRNAAVKAADRRDAGLPRESEVEDALRTMLRVAALMKRGALEGVMPSVRAAHEKLLRQVVALTKDHWSRLPLDHRSKTVVRAADAAFVEMRNRTARVLKTRSKAPVDAVTAATIERRLQAIVEATWPKEVAANFPRGWIEVRSWLNAELRGAGGAAAMASKFVEMLGGPEGDHLARVAPTAQVASSERVLAEDPTSGIPGLQRELDWRALAVELSGARVVDGEICVPGLTAVLRYDGDDTDPSTQWVVSPHEVCAGKERRTKPKRRTRSRS